MKSYSFKQKQSGFSLFMVMIIMLVLALLVVITSQSSSTEMRISTNDADRKFALSLAENGLRDGENFIGSIPTNIDNNNQTFTFNADCTNGLCLPAEAVHLEASTKGYALKGENDPIRSTPAWKREFNKKSVFDTTGRYRTGSQGNNVRYIIEFLGERPDGSRINRYFRVTSRAQGENPNTVVTLQIHVEMLN